MATFAKEPKWKKDREDKYKRAKTMDDGPRKKTFKHKPATKPAAKPDSKFAKPDTKFAKPDSKFAKPDTKFEKPKPKPPQSLSEHQAELEQAWAEMRKRRSTPASEPAAPVFDKAFDAKKGSVKDKIKAKRQKNKEERVFTNLEAPTSDVVDASFHYQEPDAPETGSRALSVAVIGRPNAGKSSLMNSLLGFNVSAVSAKYNTTRDRVLGILTQDDVQITFFDTPGLVNQKDNHKYVRSLAVTASETMSSVDLSLLVVDAVKRLDDEALEALKNIAISSAQVSAPIALVLNKMDLVGPAEKAHVTKRVQVLSEMIDAAFEEHYKPEPDFSEFDDEEDGEDEDPDFDAESFFASEEDLEEYENDEDFDEDDLLPSVTPLKLDPKTYLFDKTFKVSALKESGVKKLRSELLSLAVDRPWLYHSSIKSDRSDLDLVTEIIREKIYRRFNQELPYQIEQENRGWTPFSDKSIRIDQDLIVPSDRHKRILIGKQGDTLRSIGTSARLDIQKLLGCPVHLYLNVRSKQ
ncbi:hypothetical protein SPRG_15395 [Saprolegnia parasitica CBS 223.65]|uniref:GTPase Era n=1 Tax=Saprolegnia parasitica (strain CBS 223.65) TaxID=695850 RepID=A0A067BLH8_SAPPC|nr:hypothetical protein SPRG_15395 [Saprolegnia parasitica CBS 223.65]KDO19334.1 hypothetical protein SPRG_15395 [Saprolegnia parasitica CBS 223.65]|eukprot:XP_012209954.1 hypothetical protein SPRG_15395 [Saprolegnia parasitica CBS 223.65]